MLGKIGRLKEAEDCFRRCLSLDPGNTDGLLNLGALLAETDRLEEAESVLLALLSLAPSNLEAHLNLAQLYKARGNTVSSSRHARFAAFLR